MINKIRFLVLWVGTRCTLKCKDCCNLIPYVKQESYTFDEIVLNLEYVTKDIEIELLQIQGGEPFTHSKIDKIIEICALNPKIHRIEIASNGTIYPSEKAVKIIRRYEEKVSIRFSDYVCGKERRANIIRMLKNEYGINVKEYEFMFDTGEWFDLGNIDEKKELVCDKRERTYYKCPNKSCWTLSKNIFAGCGRMISYLMLKEDEKINGNNIIDINVLKQQNKPFIIEFQKFEERYRTAASELCGYCKIGKDLIPAGIQLTKEELNNYKYRN